MNLNADNMDTMNRVRTDIIYDVLYCVRGDFDMSVVAFGELLIDFVALESGVSVGDASGFQKAPGGAPANVAVAVARLGQRSAFLGQVGDDPFGHYLADVLDAEGVDVSGLRFSPTARTALA